MAKEEVGERKEEVNARYMYAGGLEPGRACGRPLFFVLGVLGEAGRG